MNTAELLEQMKALRVIPVVKINDASHAALLAEALTKGGLPAAEITFRTPAAEEAIRAIAKAAPHMLLLAGTVLTPETAARAVDAGAKAIVSPGTNPAVVEWCQSNGIPVMPGVATPTELEACVRMGLTALKLFPAEVVGGVKMLKALAGPYGNIQFMPTGGVTPENLGSYLAQSNVLCCGGSWIAPDQLMDQGRYDEIAALAKEACERAVSVS